MLLFIGFLTYNDKILLWLAGVLVTTKFYITKFNVYNFNEDFRCSVSKCY